MLMRYPAGYPLPMSVERPRQPRLLNADGIQSVKCLQRGAITAHLNESDDGDRQA
jgi:hypothetical protein